MQALVDRHGVTIAIQNGDGQWLFLPRPTMGLALTTLGRVDPVQVEANRAASDAALAAIHVGPMVI